MNQDLETPVTPEVQAQETHSVKRMQMDLLTSYNFAIPGTVKNLLDWMSRALNLSDTNGPSILQDKFVTVSAMANAGHEPLFAAYNALLPFIRMQVVGDFTAAKLTLKLGKQAWLH